MTLPQHMGMSAQWATPRDIVDAARDVFHGQIDCDPSTTAAINADTVRATTYWTAQESGLDPVNSWHGDVMINPPGGRGGLVKEFWSRMIDEYLCDRINSAIWIGFSIDQLQVLQCCETSPINYPICIPRRRLNYLRPVDMTPGKSPPHASYITYIGPLSSRFISVFSKIGATKI